MIKVQDWLSNNTRMLLEANIDSARLDCIVMLENTLKKPREWLLGHGDHLIDKSQENKLNSFIKMRLDHTPLAYITGCKEFYGRNFVVNPSVLIPRPESEDMIEILLGLDESSSENVMDVGTGSGCLAITAKLELPSITVVAIDNSEGALIIAVKNAERFGVDISFEKSNLLESAELTNKSIILANLPYVPDSLITSEEIKREPATAIFSGPDGMSHYAKLWGQLCAVQLKQISIITESLPDQHSKMTKLANKSGYYLNQTNGLAQLFCNF